MNFCLSKAPDDLLAIIAKEKQYKTIQTIASLSLNEYSLSKSDVGEMLSVLNPNMPYDDWLNVGMALHSGGFDMSLWDNWSSGGSEYKEGECLKKWDGFNALGGVGIGTLVHMAQNNGFSFKSKGSLKNDHSKTPARLADIKIYHWSELNNLPRRKYLIKGLLEQGAMSVIYGESNSGKTFVALDMACHVALGKPWRDKKLRKGAVVYIAAEGGLGIAERLSAFRMHHQIDGFANVYVVPSNVCLCKEESAHENLLAEIKNIPDIKLIIIDTLARAMGSGDENTSSDMGSFIQNCDIIRNETNAHVMAIHHSGKEASRGARGHSSLKAAIDTEIQVSQSDGVISAEITKQREGNTGYRLSFVLHQYEVRKDEDGDPVYSCALTETDDKMRKESLNGQARQAYLSLCNLVLESGFDCKPKKGMKIQRCVRLDNFKDHFFKAGISETDNKDSVKKAFSRSKKTLKKQGYIGEWDGIVWLLDNKDI